MLRFRGFLAFALRSLSIGVIITGCVFGFVSSVSAAASSNLLYQAHLRSSSGAMAPDGTHQIKFSLYTAPSGGTRVWTAAGTTGSPSAVTVTVVNGAFSIALGDVTGGQNSFSGLDWNQVLYLGVTVGLTDGEMTPRRVLTAVPSAFLANNALQLQGMSASSTAYGSQSLFTIHQTETSAATGTRTALEVRSEGTSDLNDYLFRTVNNLGATVFSINRQGNVTTTGNVYTSSGVSVGSTATFYGESDITSTGNYTVTSDLSLYLRGNAGNGRLTLENTAELYGDAGIMLDPGSGSILPKTDLAASLGNGLKRFNAYLGSVTSTNAMLTYVTSTLISSGLVSSTNITVDSTLTAASIYSGNVTATGGVYTKDVTASQRVANKIDGTSNIANVLSYATTMSGLKRTKVVGSRLYVQTANSIEIFDISKPNVERLLGRIYHPLITIGAFEVKDGFVYLIHQESGIRYFGIYDVHDPSTLGFYSGVAIPLSGITKVDIAISNQAAYIASGDDNSILVVDISNPLGVVLRDAIALSETPEDVQLDGHLLYVVTSNGVLNGSLLTYDVQDPLLMGLRSTVTVGEGAFRVLINASAAYVLNAADQNISVVNIASTVAPTVVQTYSLGAVPSSEHLLGERLFVGTTAGNLSLFDVSSSTSIGSLGSTSTVLTGAAIDAITSVGVHLFIGTGVTGPHLAVYSLPGMTVDALRGGQALFYAINVQGDLIVEKNIQVENSLAVGRGGVYSAGPVIGAVSSTTSTAGSFVNGLNTDSGRAWGLFTNRLLVGEDNAATGTLSYVSAFVHNSNSNRFGVCIDNQATLSTCIDFAGTSTIYSLMADDAIGANAFDLAERYAITGEAGLGDVLVIDKEQPMHMKKSSGIAYDPDLSGIVSTRPGFLLGTGGDVSVALVGRVPVNVTVSNGAIQPGDLITSSERPGVAMKATQAGRVLGRALEGTTVDGQIEVFLQPGFDASALLQADGSMTVIAQDTGFQAQGQASAATPVQSSRALLFRGSAWDGSQPAVSEFRLFNQVGSATNASLSVSYGASSSSIFALSQNGSLTLTGDLALAGKLYPSARGRAQNNSYLFVDDTQPDASYISTNANGWQSEDGYDYAERYQSPDKLEPGDLVVVRRSERLYVQRSLNDEDMLVGIVSTKPGFIAGRPQKDSYPIALAGRVPTKVSTMNGAIEPGDPLAPSTIPGVAVKAIKAGPIVGLALDAYAGSDVGKIEVFVNPTWWGGASSESGETASRSSEASLQKLEGFAEIVAGRTKVHVTLSNFTRYPHLQITPYSQMEKGWWIDRVSSRGFDIVLGGSIGRNARFSWSAKETPNDVHVSLSSGRIFDIDPISGDIIFPSGVSDEDPPAAPAPTAEPVVEEVAPVTTSTEPASLAEPTIVETPTPSAETPVSPPAESVAQPTEPENPQPL